MARLDQLDSLEAQMAEPVFSVGERTYAWADVVGSARRRGAWAAVETLARQGLACLARREASGEPASAEAVTTAAHAFRYARNLIAAEDLDAWLGARGVSTDGWMAYLDRDVLRQRWHAELADVLASHPPEPAAVAGVIWPDGVCSGHLAGLAEALAARAALYAGAGDEGAVPTPDPAGPERAGAEPATLPGLTEEQAAHLDALDATLGRVRATVCRPDAVATAIEAHRLDWLRLDCQALRCADEALAREVAMAVREDGRTLETVAGEARLDLQSGRPWLGDLAPPLRDALLSARPGELVGPLAGEDGWTLVRVLAKTAPSPEDPDACQRAEDALLQERLDREIEARVRWLAAR